jgi:MFS transporter, PPP family, 3-phenylpropionic acid transporter
VDRLSPRALVGFSRRRLRKRLWPAGAAALAASAGIVRWSVTAVAAWLPAMALVKPLHNLTFALLHLARKQLSVVVPPALAATAQGSMAAVDRMTAIMTLLSGSLSAHLARARSGSWRCFARLRCRARSRCAGSRSMHPGRVRPHSGRLLSKEGGHFDLPIAALVRLYA